MAEQIRRSGAAAWTGAFAALAERQHADAVRHDAAGHALSARERYLHAANSFRAAEYFHPSVPNSMRSWAWPAATRSWPRWPTIPSIEQAWLPWRGQRLPGYWLVPPGADEPGPALMVTSGF